MILCIYQMFMLKYIMSSVQISFFAIPLPWMMEVGFMVLAGGLAAWMFSSSAALDKGKRNTVVVITALIIAFELVTYGLQAELTGYSMLTLFPSIASGSAAEIFNYVFIIVRLMLWVLAAFFVLSTKVEKENAELAEAEEDFEEFEQDINEVVFLEEVTEEEQEEAALEAGALEGVGNPEEFFEEVAEEIEEEIAEEAEEAEEAESEAEKEKAANKKKNRKRRK